MKKFISIILIMLMLIPNVSHAESDLKSELKLEAAGEQITVKGTPTEGGRLSKGDYISFLVLKPEESFDDLMTDSEIESALCYMETLVSPPLGEEFAFTVKFNDTMPFGIYTIKLVVLKADGTSDSVVYRYNRATSEELDDAVNLFKTVDSESFYETAYEYIYNRLMFDVSDLPEFAEMMKDLGESYVLYRDGLLSGKIEGEITDIDSFDDVKYCIKAAMALYSVLESGNEDVYKKYAAVSPDFFDTNVDVKEVNEIYEAIEENGDSADEKLRNVHIGTALAYIQGGSYADVAYAIETYAGVLDIDLEYLKDNNVTVLEAARYINTNNVVQYSDSMGQAVKEIADEIIASKSVGGSNGGSPGGGSGGGSVIYPSADTVHPEPITEGENEKFVFDDVKDLSWARDSVMNLYEKGIINGVSEKNFEPDRAITREEFVKLAVTSFDLKHIEKEAAVFTDCQEDDWFYPYVQIAYANGLIKGMGDGMFGAGELIKREDAAVICLKLLEMAGKLPTIDEDKKFTDYDEISDYAVLAVMSLSQVGVINGFDDGFFRPYDTTSRAQAAVIIERLMSLK